MSVPELGRCISRSPLHNTLLNTRTCALTMTYTKLESLFAQSQRTRATRRAIFCAVWKAKVDKKGIY